MTGQTSPSTVPLTSAVGRPKVIWSLVSWYFWARYFVASSDISAIREMFLATTFVLVEAAINHSGVPGTCLALLLYISFSSFSNLSSIVF